MSKSNLRNAAVLRKIASLLTLQLHRMKALSSYIFVPIQLRVCKSIAIIAGSSHMLTSNHVVSSTSSAREGTNIL